MTCLHVRVSKSFNHAGHHRICWQRSLWLMTAHGRPWRSSLSALARENIVLGRAGVEDSRGRSESSQTSGRTTRFATPSSRIGRLVNSCSLCCFHSFFVSYPHTLMLRIQMSTVYVCVYIYTHICIYICSDIDKAQTPGGCRMPLASTFAMFNASAHRCLERWGSCSVRVSVCVGGGSRHEQLRRGFKQESCLARAGTSCSPTDVMQAGPSV